MPVASRSILEMPETATTVLNLLKKCFKMPEASKMYILKIC